MSTLLLSAAQMQSVDATAVEQGIDSFGLMRAAGRAVAEAGLALLGRRDGRVLVLAGPGNNGGDGFIAASELKRCGHEVTVLYYGHDQSSSRAGSAHPSDLSIDARRAKALWDGTVHEKLLREPGLEPPLLELIDQADLIVDALFGAGLSRPIDGELAAVINQINRSAARVVAVDVPSGLDGNSYQVLGACVEADVTVTFFRCKPAHYLYPGRALCGRKVLVQIGLTVAQLDPDWPDCLLNGPDCFRQSLPALSGQGHKYDRGHVLVRSGPMEATGAARMSAQMALACGAGLVTVASSREALPVNAAHLTAVMLKLCDTPERWAELLYDARINTVVIGPGNGVGDATRRAVLDSLRTGKCCVLDADALTSWPDRTARESLFSALAEAPGTSVLTPHEGEFSRLFGKGEMGDAQAGDQPPSRLHRALEAARRSSAVMVLKGADTVIASPDGRSAINANAPPWLATAGAGDVLAGVIAALLAQGMPPFEAACAAVWLHGDAAADLGYPMTAEQLATRLPVSLARLSPMNAWDADRG